MNWSFDPATGAYAVQTDWNEYGVGYGQNLGRPTDANPFFWQATWATPKRINHVTFGGTYPNQPQPATRWPVERAQRWDAPAAWTAADPAVEARRRATHGEPGGRPPGMCAGSGMGACIIAGPAPGWGPAIG